MSSLGRVRRAPWAQCRGTVAGKVLRHSLIRGYHKVDIRRDGVTVSRYVHQLVLEAFVGPRGTHAHTRHLNGNREDNRVSNLAWGDAATNADDKRLHGTILRGDAHPNSKLTEQQVAEIRMSPEPPRALAPIYGVSSSHISAIRRGGKRA